MNQTQFAEKVGITKAWLSMILSGAEMGKNAAKKMAPVLGLHWAKVLTLPVDELRDRIKKL